MHVRGVQMHEHKCALTSYEVCYWSHLKQLPVVSTVISGILFARFPTVECISKGESFLY